VSAKLRPGNAEKMLEMFGTEGFDTIIFFASLEHMTISERLVSLRDAWTMLPSGGHLVIIETPNRLWLVDTHTAQLPFYHWLPDELAFHYARMSPRPRFRTMYNIYEATSKLNFLRDGRGMSYHELDLAIGPAEDLQVISSLSIFDHSKARKWRGNPNSDIRSAYQGILRCVRPDLHTGFFEEWLDIIIRKP
jgi:S-adenosylmethionine-dependent methyltransferase